MRMSNFKPRGFEKIQISRAALLIVKTLIDLNEYRMAVIERDFFFISRQGGLNIRNAAALTQAKKYTARCITKEGL